MKIFKVYNKASRRILVVADSENSALEIALKLKHARKIENLSATDFTAGYLSCNAGLDLSKLKPGQLFKVISGPNSQTWNTYSK